jgi:Lon protease-like protein
VVSELGLFPLRIVLLPGEVVPLHIFEPRYQELIGECLEDDRPFGIVLEDDAGQRDVGTSAAVVEVLERFEDGRLNIVVRGGERFRVHEVTEERSFRTAEVETIEDDEDPADEGVRQRALELFRTLRTLVGSEVEEPADEPLSFALAARVELGPAAKQQLLELTSERRRLALVTKLFERGVAGVRLQQEVQERAKHNGRVSLPPDLQRP